MPPWRTPRLQVCRASQIAQANFKPGADPEQVHDGDVVLTALNAAHVGAVKPNVMGKCFLRQANPVPLSTDGRSQRDKRGISSVRRGGLCHVHMFVGGWIKHHGIRYPSLPQRTAVDVVDGRCQKGVRFTFTDEIMRGKYRAVALQP